MSFNRTQISSFLLTFGLASVLAGCNGNNTGGTDFCGTVAQFSKQLNEAIVPSTGVINSSALQVQSERPTKLLVRLKKEQNGVVSSRAVKEKNLTQQLPNSIELELITEDLYSIRFENADDAERYAADLKLNPAVKLVEADSKVYATFTPNDVMFSRQWQHQALQSSAAWDITQGSENITVAVVDTGIDYNHEDLSANMWKNSKEIPNNGIDDDGNGFIDDVYGWNFINNSNQVISDDQYGHGTHVAGIIGAVANNSVGGAGVSPKVRLMALKFLDSTGSGDTSNAVKGIYYAIKQGAKVINASWGGTDPSDALQQAINDARAAGVLVVVAAGNDGANNDTTASYPANNDNVFSVASTNCSDSMSSFSNYSATKVHIGAPGEQIISTIINNQYGSLSGTSMATPMVSGVAALVLAAHPGLTPAQVQAQIMANSDVIPALQGKVASNGRLNAYKVLKALAQAANVMVLTPFRFLLASL